MPIPPIPPYPMPTADDLPAPSVGWRPDPARAALLVHDMQRYFLAPYAPDQSPRRDLEDNLAALTAAARRAGMPVVYTAQPGDMTAEQRGLLHDFWGPGMSRADDDRAILDRHAPEHGDAVLTKWRYSAFHDTGLAERMAAEGRDQMLVTGVYANTGCLMSAVDGFSHDIETFFVGDAVADFTRADHRQALHYAAKRCAAVVATAGVLDDLADLSTVADLGRRASSTAA